MRACRRARRPGYALVARMALPMSRTRPACSDAAADEARGPVIENDLPVPAAPNARTTDQSKQRSVRVERRDRPSAMMAITCGIAFAAQDSFDSRSANAREEFCLRRTCALEKAARNHSAALQLHHLC